MYSCFITQLTKLISVLAYFFSFPNCLCSHWSEPAESLGRSLRDLHPGMSDPWPLRQLLDAPSPDPVPDVHHHHHPAFLRLPAELGSRRQDGRASHLRPVSTQGRSGQRNQPSAVLQHVGETLHQQESGASQGHTSGQLHFTWTADFSFLHWGQRLLHARAPVVRSAVTSTPPCKL